MNEPIRIAGFPVDASVALKKHVEHRGLRLEIVNHNRSKYDYGRQSERDSDGTWCYYITVTEQMLPEDKFAEFWLAPSSTHKRSSGWDEPSYAYYAARFAGVTWHGGVTYYEKLGGIDGRPRAVKIGCDFAHYWDEGYSYEFEYVLSEAQATADQLCEMYAFYSRCPYMGKWQPASEMVERDGKLFCVEGIEAMEKSAAERAEKEAA